MYILKNILKYFKNIHSIDENRLNLPLIYMQICNQIFHPCSKYRYILPILSDGCCAASNGVLIDGVIIKPKEQQLNLILSNKIF